MIDDRTNWVNGALSSARFATYLAESNGDFGTAFRLYQWNLDVCSAFYGPLHWLEVSLRNALDQSLRKHYGRADWWVIAPLSDHGQRLIINAREELARETARKRRSGHNVTDPCADDIVAKLSFGFWVSLLSRGRAYDRTLWVPALYKAFPHSARSRRALHQELDKLRCLRNRIMHYEPVFNYDLGSYQVEIYRQLGYLSPVVAERVRPLDRITGVLARYEQVWTGRNESDTEN